MSSTMDAVCKSKTHEMTTDPVAGTGAAPGGLAPAPSSGQVTICSDWTKLSTTRALLSTMAAFGSSSMDDLQAMINGAPAARDSAVKYLVKAVLVNGRGNLARREPYLRMALAAFTKEFGATTGTSTIDATALAARIAQFADPLRDVFADVEALLKDAGGERSKVVLAYSQGVRDLADALRLGLRTDETTNPDLARLDSALAPVAQVAHGLLRVGHERGLARGELHHAPPFGPVHVDHAGGAPDPVVFVAHRFGNLAVLPVDDVGEPLDA